MRRTPGQSLLTTRRANAEPALSLHDVRYEGGDMKYPDRRRYDHEGHYEQYLARARRIFDEAAADPPEALGPPQVTVDFEKLRWFPLPDELRAELVAATDASSDD